MARIALYVVSDVVTAPKKRERKGDPIFPRKRTMALAERLCQVGSLAEAVRVLRRSVVGLPKAGRGSGWRKMLLKLAKGLDDVNKGGKPNWALFAEGNSKLPFFSWSTLPFLTCPGMGECRKFCYSPKGWRYPEVFCRQVGNTLLLRFQRELVRQAFLALPWEVQVRLYVDGDFGSVGDVAFWMSCLEARPDIRAYGYSKSWDELLAYDADAIWPQNYVLNVSSGSRHGEDVKARVLALPCTRGEFVAVPVHYRPAGHKGNVGFSRYKDDEYHRQVREAARAAGITGRILSCPGECGECCGGQHACGQRGRLDGVTIVNGAH